MRFLKYNEKIMLLVLSLLLIGLLTITIYFSMNYDEFTNEENKIAVLSSEKFDENIEKLSRRKNITVYSNDNYKQNPNNILREIESIYSEYSLFIIVMEKSDIPIMANYLSFMVENLSKSIIFTENHDLTYLIKKTRSIAIPEVIVNNGKQLLRGVTTQLNVSGDLVSYKHPALDNINCLDFPKETINFKTIDPEITISFGKNTKDTAGIIFDLKNIPSPNSLDKIKIPYIILSENTIKDIKTYDMTREAAFCKLMFLLSNIQEKAIIKQLLDINFRGEIIIDGQTSQKLSLL